jgi:hypothetical protein
MNNFREIAGKLNLEVHETIGGAVLFGLKWGESKVGQVLGISRKKQVEALNWADKNPKEALSILTGK